MNDIEIVNPVPVDQVEPWLSAMAVTYLGDPGEIRSDLQSRVATWEPERAWGARADGRWVATLRSLPRRLTVPGARSELAADAVTNVSVATTHRRQGLLTTMLTDSLAAAKERGDAVSILISAEWPIYGRYGYAPALDGAHYTVRTRLPGSRLSRRGSGRVRLVDADEFAIVAPAVFDTARTQRAGNIDRPRLWWERHLAPDNKRPAPVHVIHEGPDGIDGYLTWAPTRDWDPTGDLGQVTVREMMTTNDGAYLDLWHYLMGIDIVDEVHVRDRPVDEPLPWLLADGRAIRQTHRIDRVWLRLLDPAVALGARRYASTDSLVIEVTDADCGRFAAGRYLLEGSPDGSECSRTTREPDLRMTQRALAAIYLGGFNLSQLLITGDVDEITSGAVQRVDTMFATALAPWCATGF